jgi:hypothetical protein
MLSTLGSLGLAGRPPDPNSAQASVSLTQLVAKRPLTY